MNLPAITKFLVDAFEIYDMLAVALDTSVRALDRAGVACIFW